MTPEMQEALIRLSLCYSPDPAVVFREVIQTIADLYNGTMAMINLVDGDNLLFYQVVNPHPLLKDVASLPLKDTY
jgi:hypothetical protein